MTNTPDTRPTVSPIEGHYAMLRNGMIARPIIDDHAWLRQGLKQNVDPYLELVWFDDGRCHPNSGLEEFADEYDIIATISPQMMQWAADPKALAQMITEEVRKIMEPFVPLIAAADAACDYADANCRWFDISTAPRDEGLSFLASIEIRNPSTIWREVHVLHLNEDGEIHIDCHQGWSLGDYTHWRPLPPPPSTDPLPAVFVELGQALEKIKGVGSLNQKLEPCNVI
jgi:hypothetical protein